MLKTRWNYNICLLDTKSLFLYLSQVSLKLTRCWTFSSPLPCLSEALSPSFWTTLSRVRRLISFTLVLTLAILKIHFALQTDYEIVVKKKKWKSYQCILFIRFLFVSFGILSYLQLISPPFPLRLPRRTRPQEAETWCWSQCSRTGRDEILWSAIWNGHHPQIPHLQVHPH